MSTTNIDSAIDVFAEHESAVRSYCRKFPTVFSTARDCRIYDITGRPYLDLLSGAGTLNYGHNNPAIMEAILSYITKYGIVHGLDMHTEAKLEFIRTFQDSILARRDMRYKLQFPGPTGTNAVEAAFKLARKITGRHRIVSFTNGYHGMTMGALAATANCGTQTDVFASRGGVIFMPYDGSLPGIDSIEVVEGMTRKIVSKAELPAAFIVETVQGEGGLNAASVQWLKKLEELAKELGALLIVDDIQAGNGRTGKFFSFENHEISPDIILLSKSLSGFGTPFSLVLIKPEIDTWSPGEHTGTFRGNNLAFVGATSAIETYWRDKGLESSVSRKATIVRKSLVAISSKLPEGEVRVKGRGLFQGLEFADTEMAGRVSRRMFDAGFIIETCGPNNEVLKLLPPLTISMEDLNQSLQHIGHSVVEEYRSATKVA